MIVDDYYYEARKPLFVEVYDDKSAGRFAAEIGDRLRLMRGERDPLFLYHPKRHRALGGLYGEESRLLLACGYGDRDLVITIADRDADYEHDCNRYCVEISAVDGSDLRRLLREAEVRRRLF